MGLFSRLGHASSTFFDIMARGYDGAIDTRFRNQHAFNQSPEGSEDTIVGVHDRRRLQLECRHMQRNNPIAHGAVDRLAEYAVFDGIWPQARTSSDDWNTEAEQWWRHVYAPNADWSQKAGVTITTHQKMIITERMNAGELGFILLKNGQVQPIEASRIGTPSKYKADKGVIDGVRRSKSGIILGYYVLPRKNGGGIDNTKGKYVRRENFIHCWRQTRPDMVRGIPELAPLINHLRDYKETDENVRAKIKADAATWAKSKRERAAQNTRARGSYRVTDSNSQNPQRVEKLEGLRLLNMGKDEDVDPFDSKTPNAQYIGYMEHSLRLMAQCINIPYEFLMLLFTKGSFSAQRAAKQAAHHTIIGWVFDINRCFNIRMWNWRVAKAINNKELPPAPVVGGMSEWWKTEWSLPFWQELDTDKQARGDSAKWRMGATSMKSLIASQHGDRNSTFQEKGEDIVQAYKVAKWASEKIGEKVTWEKIIDVATGQTMAPDPEETETPPGKEDEE